MFQRLSSSHSSSSPLAVDLGTVWGIVAAFGLVLLAISLGGGLGSFWDLQSLLVVIGGTLGATLITFPLEDLRRTVAALRTAFYPEPHCAQERLVRLVEMGRRARTEGELSLEGYTQSEPDQFLRKGLLLVADATPPTELRRLLELEVAILGDRHRRGAQVFQTMGAVAPAMGLIGTLIGLVRMLEMLDNPASIGPAMAVALLTTFYGAIAAYMVFLPLAGKLRARSEEEAQIKEMTIEGLVAIAEGLNPRLIETRLESFLSPEERDPLYGTAA